MTTLSTSPRTLIRDAIMSMLETRKNQALSRIQSFAVSPKFLSPPELTQSNTYCVIATDEAFQRSTHSVDESELTIKLVIYAKDTKDPRAPLDAMIEDARDAMTGLIGHPDVRGVVSRVVPESIATNESTTDAEHLAQAVFVWTIQQRRS